MDNACLPEFQIKQGLDAALRRDIAELARAVRAETRAETIEECAKGERKTDMDEKVKPFDPSKAVRTRGNKRVRIIATDINNDGWPIGALVTEDDGREVFYKYTVDGRRTLSSIHSYDLINIPEKRTVWVNIYECGHCSYYSTSHRAFENALSSRIACVKVEFEEGEGL